MIEIKKTTVRLDVSQQALVEIGLSERSRIVSESIQTFLDWDSYTQTPWKDAHVFGGVGDGQIWLDVVEMGVEYKTKSILLKPVAIKLPADTFEKLEEAERRVIKYRPKLKGKGILAGIIRSAIAQAYLSGDIEIKPKEVA